jgi:hypothetical protein
LNPIDFATSQRLMREFAARDGWDQEDAGRGLQLEVTRDGYGLSFDTSWNLLELTTPPVRVSEADDLFETVLAILDRIRAVGQDLGAVPVRRHFDGDTTDTLLIASQQARLHLQIDGRARRHLGHIAAVHYNIDLCSVDEGLAWQRPLASLFDRQGWPPRESRDGWHAFVSSSAARYEQHRYGPAPDRLEVYLRDLAEMTVYLDSSGDGWRRVVPHHAFGQQAVLDVEAFLGSVWWWSRLRKKDDRLVVEIRPVPRSNDAGIARDWEAVSHALGLPASSIT